MKRETIEVEKPVFRRIKPGLDRVFTTRGVEKSAKEEIDPEEIPDSFHPMGDPEDYPDTGIPLPDDNQNIPDPEKFRQYREEYRPDELDPVTGEPFDAASTLHPPGEMFQVAQADPYSVTDESSPEEELEDETAVDDAELRTASGGDDEMPADQPSDDDLVLRAASEGDINTPEKTVIEGMRSSYDPGLLEYVDSQGVDAITAAVSTIKGLKKYEVDEDHGWIAKTLTPLTAAGQFIAKESAVLLNAFGSLDEEETKMILSQTMVMPSDITDVLIQKQPWGKDFLESMHSYAPGSHTVAKILIDTLLDPVTYLAAPAKGAKTLFDATGNVVDASKISGREAAFLKTGERMVDVTSDLNLAVTASAEQRAGKAWTAAGREKILLDAEVKRTANLEALANYAKEKITIEEFSLALRGPKDGVKNARQAAVETWRWANSEPGLFEGLASGQRELAMRFRVPFTNVTKTVPLPQRMGTGAGKFAMSLMDATVKMGGLLAKPIPKGANDLFNSAIKASSVFAKGLLTKTGLYDVDSAVNIFHHTDSAGQMARADFHSRWSDIMKEWSPDQIKDVTDELEFAVDNISEALISAGKKPFQPDPRRLFRPESMSQLRELIKDFPQDVADEVINSALGISKVPIVAGTDFVEAVDKIKAHISKGIAYGDDISVQQIATPIKTTAEFKHLKRKIPDVERFRRMTPEQHKMVEEIRHLMETASDEFKKRGIPYEDLAIFSKNWKKNHAKGYLKHLQTSEYMATQSLSKDEALDRLVQWTNKVDKGSLGREYRGGINEANEKALQNLGIKIFVDNPLELAIYRHKEMMDTIRRHDLIKASLPHIVDYDVFKMNPTGYIKIQEEHWSQFAARSAENIKPEYFLPKQFIPFALEEKDGYLPAQVYERLRFLANPERTNSTMLSILGKAMDLWNWPFRNMALSGPGYLGNNLLSNLVAFQTVPFGNSFRQIRALKDATWLVTPKYEKLRSPVFFDMIDSAGNKIALTREQLISIAAEQGVLRSGQAYELSDYALAEMRAKTYSQRDFIYDLPLKDMWGHIKNAVTGKSKGMGTVIAKSALDIMAGWRASRSIAQYSDDIPKLAVFIDRLRDGYSVEAARDAANLYFYDFKNVGQSHAQARRAFAFSSFAMKTAESAFEQARDIGLGRILLPTKAYHVMQGAFVPDANTHDRLNSITPDYMIKGQNPIHGILMPGGYEAVLEAPFYQNSLNYIFDPEAGIHPMIQMIMNLGASKAPDSEMAGYNFYDGIRRGPEDASVPEAVAGANLWNGWSRFMWESNLLPKWWLDSLALAEINGAIDAGGFFANKYSQNLPISDDPQAAYNRKFNNAVELGQYWIERGGPGILGEVIVGGVDPNDYTERGETTKARIGNFTASRIRDMSFGLVRMSNVDRGFFTRLGSIDRQINYYKNMQKTNDASLYRMKDPARLEDRDFLENIGENNRVERKLYELTEKRDSLVEWYEFYSQVEREYPQGGVWDLIFGSSKYQYQFNARPDNVLNPEKQPGRKELLEQMFPSTEDLMENTGTKGEQDE